MQPETPRAITPPPMPDWSPPNGPWCLKRWLVLPSKAADGYSMCLRELDHEGDCRDVRHRWLTTDTAMFLGDHSGAHQ